MNPLPFKQTAYKGEDFSFSIQLNNGTTNTAFNLTGCSVSSILRIGIGGPKAATLSPSITSTTGGTIGVLVYKDTIQPLSPFPYNLYVWLTTPDGIKTLIVDGTLNIVEA